MQRQGHSKLVEVLQKRTMSSKSRIKSIYRLTNADKKILKMKKIELVTNLVIVKLFVTVDKLKHIFYNFIFFATYFAHYSRHV